MLGITLEEAYLSSGSVKSLSLFLIPVHPLIYIHEICGLPAYRLPSISLQLKYAALAFPRLR